MLPEPQALRATRTPARTPAPATPPSPAPSAPPRPATRAPWSTLPTPAKSDSPIYNHSGHFVVYGSAGVVRDVNRGARPHGEGTRVEQLHSQDCAHRCDGSHAGRGRRGRGPRSQRLEHRRQRHNHRQHRKHHKRKPSTALLHPEPLRRPARAEFRPGNKVGFILTLTNEGQRSCSLDGYPGLDLEDFGHHPLPSHTFWGPTFFDRDPGRQLIVLSPGETASASLAFVSGATKHAVDASYLVVTPPNAYDHLVIGPFSRSMAIPIYRGNLYVTAMAWHTAHP